QRPHRTAPRAWHAPRPVGCRPASVPLLPQMRRNLLRAFARAQTPASRMTGPSRPRYSCAMFAGMADQLPRQTSIAGREHDSYVVLPGRTGRGLIVVCDHAGNLLPPEYGTLGLPEPQLQRHIAYDIGVAPIVRALVAELGVPAAMTRYSRLLI